MSLIYHMLHHHSNGSVDLQGGIVEEGDKLADKLLKMRMDVSICCSSPRRPPSLHLASIWPPQFKGTNPNDASFPTWFAHLFTLKAFVCEP